MKNWYIVSDFDAFVLAVRKLVFNNFGKADHDSITDAFNNIKSDEQQEFDEVLSQDEAHLIAKPLVKTRVNKKTKESELIINDEIFMNIAEKMGDRMVSNILNSLVNRGLVETAFDSDSNEFVFWVKDTTK
jgi:hypothetical protein